MVGTTSSAVSLLDANVLVALLWPHHRHHTTAHQWFSSEPKRLWASCAITQSAFVRISLNERVHGVKADYSDILHRLGQTTARADHEFWEVLPALSELPALLRFLVQGHRQMTDAYLLALAQHRGGRLATFDAGIPTLLPSAAERKRWVELIVP